MAYHNGWFYLFFSAFYHDAGRERSHVVGVKTKDFIKYSEPIINWRGKEEGWIGLCSPNVSKIGNKFYLTYNSWGDKSDKKNQLFYAVSNNLEDWQHAPLARGITRKKRAIDAAIFFEKGKFILIYKEYQTTMVAWAEYLNGPWKIIGKVAGGMLWMENYQLVSIGRIPRLICTTKSDYPVMAAMDIEAVQELGAIKKWVAFMDFKELKIPKESFNTYGKVGNAPFLADWRENDGYFYLLYAGKTEGKTHLKRGDNKLGVSRSKNLKDWSAPGTGSIKK